MQEWYVVQTKPHKESVAVENLERQGYIAYCPQITQAKHRRRRWQQVIEPLFPRYLFVQLSSGLDDFSPIRFTTGVQNMVHFGGKPAAMPQQVIDEIHQQESRLFEQATPRPQWQSGDRLQIIDGPFAGLNGLFEKTNCEERVIILLQILGRNNKITVNINSLVAV